MAERRVLWLGLALLVLCGAFLAWQLRQPVGFILGLRAAKLGALVCVGAATGAATVLFQTVAGNRLLTPGLVGFDALFVLMQTLLVLLLGGVGAAAIPAGPRFLMEVAALGVASVALFGLLLRRDARDITRMILTGIILGVLLRGLSSMVQRLMDPSDFAVVQQAMFASFGRVDPQQLTFSAVVLLAAMAVALRMAPALDVAGLGRDTARGLGLTRSRRSSARRGRCRRS